MSVRNSLIGVARGMVEVSAVAYGSGHFPTWTKPPLFRVLRFWELMRGLAEDGASGFCKTWLSHRHGDAQWQAELDERAWWDAHRVAA